VRGRVWQKCVNSVRLLCSCCVCLDKNASRDKGVVPAFAQALGDVPRAMLVPSGGYQSTLELGAQRHRLVGEASHRSEELARRTSRRIGLVWAGQGTMLALAGGRR